MEDIKVIYRMKLSPSLTGEKWVEAIKKGNRNGHRFYQFSLEETEASAARNPMNTSEYLPWDDAHITKVEWDD
jgi:hypothetical protein